MHTYIEDKNAVVVNLDGDDWLLGRDALATVTQTYKTNPVSFTYGNCVYYAPGHVWHGRVATDVSAHSNRRYSPWVDKHGLYRQEPFYPLHLRTWKAGLFLNIDEGEFKRSDGSWIQFCEDQAMYYPFFESQEPYAVISTPLCVYNYRTALSDDTIHLSGRLRDEVLLRRRIHAA
jgi:hypothetical protein